MNKFLVVKVGEDIDITQNGMLSISKILKVENLEYDIVNTPTISSASIAATIAIDHHDYAGVIVVGLVNDNEVQKIQLSYKNMNEIGMHYTMPIGFGVEILSNTKGNVFVNAANECIALYKLKQQYVALQDRETGNYNEH